MYLMAGMNNLIVSNNVDVAVSEDTNVTEMSVYNVDLPLCHC